MTGEIDDDRALSAKEVAHALHCSERTLWRMVKDRKFFRPVVTGTGRKAWYGKHLRIYHEMVQLGWFVEGPIDVPEEEDE